MSFVLTQYEDCLKFAIPYAKKDNGTDTQCPDFNLSLLEGIVKTEGEFVILVGKLDPEYHQSYLEGIWSANNNAYSKNESAQDYKKDRTPKWEAIAPDKINWDLPVVLKYKLDTPRAKALAWIESQYSENGKGFKGSLGLTEASMAVKRISEGKAKSGDLNSFCDSFEILEEVSINFDLSVDTSTGKKGGYSSAQTELAKLNDRVTWFEQLLSNDESPQRKLLLTLQAANEEFTPIHFAELILSGKASLPPF